MCRNWAPRRSEADPIVGLAPHARDFGRFKGRGHISVGLEDVRASLFMAALAASKSNPAMRTFTARPKTREKATIVVVTAVMRNLVVIVNAVLMVGEPMKDCPSMLALRNWLSIAATYQCW